MTAPARTASYDPLAVVDALLRSLAREGVPVAVHSLERAIEDAQRLLRDLGVEATEPGVERERDDALWRAYEAAAVDDEKGVEVVNTPGGRPPSVRPFTRRGHLSVVRP